jgi:hypothetical protein
MSIFVDPIWGAWLAGGLEQTPTWSKLLSTGYNTWHQFLLQWDTYLNFGFYIADLRLIIYHLIQQPHSQQQTITCHFPVCPVHVAACTRPSSGRAPAVEYSNDCFCSRCAYVELKLQKIFKIKTNYNYFSLNCVTFHVNIHLSLQTNI